MSNSVSGQRAYSPTQGTVGLSPDPIVAQRNPATTDRGFVGQIWTNILTQATYINAGTVANSTTWNEVTSGGGAGVFDSLTVTGTSIQNGTTSINNNNNASTNINTGTSTGNIAIGNAAAGTVVIESGAATANAIDITAAGVTGGVTIATGTGGIGLLSAGIFDAQDLVPGPVASPTATVAAAANLGTVTFTGFTTAAYAAGTITTQVFTITNANITTSSGVLFTVNNLGTNDAQMAITRVKLAAGSAAVTVGNFGSAALNGNLEISFWFYRY